MLQVKAILTPVDFSPCSINALQYAASLAKSCNASLRILYVASNNHVTVVNGKDVESEDAVKELLKANYLLQVKTSCSITSGNIEKEILSAQSNYKIDLIVMGTLGANKFNRKIFGTTTAHVIQNSHCPVLAVPEGVMFSSLKKIAFATDLTHSNLEIANESTSFFKMFDSEMQFFYVDTDGKYKHDAEYKLGQAEIKIRKYVDYQNLNLQLSKHQKVKDGINSFMRKSKPDLLVMVNHKRNLLQSLYETSQTREMVHITNFPLLALPLV